jgi:hypothetical protein
LHNVEDDVMTTRYKSAAMTTAYQSVVTEITDEAYKQNTVYRPWSEIEARKASAGPVATSAPPPSSSSRG